MTKVTHFLTNYIQKLRELDLQGVLLDLWVDPGTWLLFCFFSFFERILAVGELRKAAKKSALMADWRKEKYFCLSWQTNPSRTKPLPS